MNHDDYVCHVRRKIKLAVAFAIIKSKPANQTTDEYIQTLRQKLSEEQMDIDVISIHSEDFNFDEGEDNFQKHSAKINSNTMARELDFENVIESTTLAKTVPEKVVERDDNLFGEEQDTADFDKINIDPIIIDSIKSRIGQINELKNSKFIPESQVLDDDTQITQTDKIQKNTITNSCVASTYCFDKEANPTSAIDSQATEFYLLDCTHVSQSQDNRFALLEKYKKRKVGKENVENEQSKKICNNMTVTGNVCYNNCIKNDENCVKFVDNTKNVALNLDIVSYKNQVEPKNNSAETKRQKTIDEKRISQELQDLDFTTSIELDEELTKEIQELKRTQELNKQRQELATSQFFETQELEQDNLESQENEMDDIFDSQNEGVPFKIIEELNRVKTYLRRSVEGSESGYRSDSTHRGSSKTSPPAGWLHQAAHALLQHCRRAPPRGARAHVAHEAALVLGALVDSLHDQEVYPPFLDALLDAVQGLVEQVHCEAREGHEMEKDEAIHKLMRLTHSVHVVGYALEKIYAKLENIYTKLTHEDIYEITDIDSVKNISYIFHVLEILLQRYMRKKTNLYKKQDFKEKKSSISDIWRRKWQPEEEIDNKVEEKECVLEKIRNVLNKLIVECMEGYSLVAFAALQCYNVLQK